MAKIRHAAAKLGMLVAAHGGPGQAPKPRQYTKHKVAPARRPMTPPQPTIIEDRGDLLSLYRQRQAELDYLAGQDEELRSVRWFFYMVIEAAKWGEERHRQGGTVLCTFGRYGLGAGLLVDPMRAAMGHVAS